MNDKAKQSLEEWRELGIKVERKNLLEKNKENPTRKNAINAMCYQCMGGEETVHVVGIIADIKCCGSHKCPLHPWRPYT
jgi:hypothetical protein